jgi:alkanesulfonate monooxygenase SsuD/methylene tetrahydromethanopterin reductase-like flavin-dependent oxidoreductase (luciferase family)
MGGPRRGPGEAVEALDEAIDIVRQAWSGARSVKLDGKHYRAHGYHPGPAPLHPIEIWIGAYRPRMLRLTGRMADGWMPSLGRLDISDLASMHVLIDEGARAAGRHPASIRRLINISGSIGDVETSAGGVGSLGDGLAGSADDWVERITGWVAANGFDTFILWPSLPDEQQVRAWAEIAWRVREVVAARRAR